jgi:parallel beta-helix repeat protein
MVRVPLRTLALAAVAAFALTPAPAAAVTPVSACQTLNKAGETYVLTADITASSDCFLIEADRITLDLGGHTITGPGSGSSVGVWDPNPHTLTVVKNGTITGFLVAIDFQHGTRSTVRAITASDNLVGIQLGQGSLVKDCIVQRNEMNGININSGIDSSALAQVEGCLIGGPDSNGNGGVGISGANRMLVTRNTVIGNGNAGILVNANSTVTHNTVSDNGADGINVGPGSLVTRNTSNENDGDGIEAVCPSTITHNTALDNDGLDINAIGPGCSILHNTVSPADPT